MVGGHKRQGWIMNIGGTFNATSWIRLACAALGCWVAFPVAASIQPPAPATSPAAPPSSPPPPSPHTPKPDAPETVIDEDDPNSGDEELSPVSLPDSDLGRAMKWVMEIINGDQPLGKLEDHFTPAFLDSPGGAKVRDRLTSLRRQAFDGHLVQVVGMSQQDSNDAGAFTINGEGTRTILNVFVVVDSRTGKLAGLSFAAPPPGANGNTDAPESFGEMNNSLGGLGGGTSLGIYELIALDPKDLTKGYRLAAVYEYGDTMSQNINTVAMIFPLGTLAGQIAESRGGAGETTWASTVTIKDSLKSLPGSSFFDLPDGTTKTLADVAKATMEGDFTASDVSVMAAKPTAVEDWSRKIVHAGGDTMFVGRNEPFLTTRQAYTLKLAKDRTLGERFARADRVDRRELLIKEVAATEPDEEVAGEIEGPMAIEEIGWFATVREVGRAWAELHRLESMPGMEPLKDALRASPAILQLNEDLWSEVSSKTGAEPGVMSMSWKLKRRDERWFVVVATWNNPQELLDQPRFFALAASGLDILSKFETGDNPEPPLEKKLKRKGPRF